MDEGKYITKWQIGDKIIFAYPDWGYDSDQKQAKKYLQLNKKYTLKEIEIRQSHSTVKLVEIPHEWFNSIHFVNL